MERGKDPCKRCSITIHLPLLLTCFSPHLLLPLTCFSPSHASPLTCFSPRLLLPLTCFFLCLPSEGFGAWSSEGCSVMEETEADIKCACNHLTSFTVVQVYIIYVCALNVCVRVCVFTYMVDVHECVTLTA